MIGTVPGAIKGSRCYEKFQVIRPAVLATVCGVWNELSAGTSEICSAFDPYVGYKAKIYAQFFSFWRYLLGVRNISNAGLKPPAE